VKTTASGDNVGEVFTSHLPLPQFNDQYGIVTDAASGETYRAVCVQKSPEDAMEFHIVLKDRVVHPILRSRKRPDNMEKNTLKAHLAKGVFRNDWEREVYGDGLVYSSELSKHVLRSCAQRTAKRKQVKGGASAPSGSASSRPAKRARPTPSAEVATMTPPRSPAVAASLTVTASPSVVTATVAHAPASASASAPTVVSGAVGGSPTTISIPLVVTLTFAAPL
jgi:hypothetical protein